MIYIWLNTYNRPKYLQRLLDSIYKERGVHDLFVKVYDDGSDLDYDASLWPDLNIKYIKVNHHGKEKYWQLYNLGMQNIKKFHSKYFLRLDDDVELVDGFFDKCIDIWESITDPNKISLFPLLDSREGKPAWTGHIPKKETFGDISIYNNGWVDDMFFANRRLFEVINFNIPPISPKRWTKNPKASTGTGQYISRFLHRAGYKMYCVTETLLIHDHHKSVMNPNFDSQRKFK